MTLYEPIVAACARALRPLQRSLTDPDALRGLLIELGWEAVPAPDDVAALAALLPVAPITRAIELADELARTGRLDAEDLVELASVIEEVAASVSALADVTPLALADFGNELGDPALWTDVAAVLAEYLFLRLLEHEAPVIASILRLLGVVRWEVRGHVPRLGRWRIAWDQVPTVFSDPLTALQHSIGWGATFLPENLLSLLRVASARLGVSVAVAPMSDAVREAIAAGGHGDPTGLVQSELVFGRGTSGGAAYEAGVVVASAATASEPVGLYVGNLCTGQVEAGMTVGRWSVGVTGEVEGTATVGAIVRPDETTPIVSIPSGEVSVSLTGSPDEPWRLVGTTEGTRIELSGLELALGLTIDGPSSELWGSVGTLGDGLSIVIDLGGADNFIGSFIGGAVPTVDIAGSIRVGSRTGITVSGSLGLEVVLPVERQIGPLYVTNLIANLGSGDSGFELGLAIGAELTIGPFAASVDKIGTGVVIANNPTSARFAGLDASLTFIPPSRIGFELTTEAARGGGFVSIEPEIGRYTGGLSLDFVSIGIDAIVVIDTQLPGDPDGWSFFASLAASFPGIPLGFGFTLNGVGGLIALNRTMDAEALASALRNGVIDALLFPDDPIGQSAQLVAQIDEYFPLREGNTVIGPVIEIGWGSPTLITAQLGVVLSLPDGIIAVMGSVEALLPIPTAPLITLHMDSLGVIDVGAGTFSLTASLYDSKLLQVIDLSGDMAMYLQVSGQPYFLLSVGGYHPGFEPPSIVPAAMHDLRRMRAAISIASNVSVSVEAYFAVTSNSVQFGAAVNVIASVEIWPSTYSAKGWFNFDVLLVFSPFKIVASMSAGVGIYSGDKELMGVQLSLLLEGPEPWYAAGTASFKFFGLKVKFELEVGSTAAGEPRPIAHPRTDVLAALASPASWSETAPLDGLAAGITYVSATPEDETVWVRPDHQLTVRQSIAPLNRTLEIVGQAVPASGEELLTVIDAGFDTPGDVDWDLADDWFAPAQFETLGKIDKLTRASFEEMTAGVTFGAPGVAIPADTDLMTTVSTAYETDAFDDDDDKETWGPDPAADFLAHSVNTGAAGTGLRHMVAPTASPMFAITPTAYTLVRTTDGATAADVLDDAGLPVNGVTQYEAMKARHAALADVEAKASRLVLVPHSTALEPVV